jgi:Flp pilus assembly protein TadG
VRLRATRNGVVLLLTVGLLGVVLPMVGLAIDTGLVYAVRTKLSAAADAAALAGARSLNRGMSLAAQKDSAEATARAFVDANFPDGHLLTSHRTVSPDVQETALRTRTVKTDLTVDVPTFFLRMLGIRSTTIQAGGTASRRDVNLVLVLDRSGSMQAAMPAMRAAARDFVDKFAEARDNVSLIVFSGTAVVAFPNPASDGAKSNFKSASPSVDTLISQTVSGGSTTTAAALWQAYQQLALVNQPGALNLIVFFTDGVPEALTGDFNSPDPAKNLLKAGSACDYRVDTIANGLRVHPIYGYICPAGSQTWGILRNSGDSVTSTSEVVTANSRNCSYSDTAKQNMHNDVRVMPASDLYGNATTGYRAVDLTQLSNAQQIKNAAINAADSAVMRIRADRGLGVVIYAIGYEGGTYIPDETWMKRIANDPSSPSYDRTVPQGLYEKAPTTAELNAAFAKVASEILRLAQ